jgi:hypothetical protein
MMALFFRFVAENEGGKNHPPKKKKKKKKKKAQQSFQRVTKLCKLIFEFFSNEIAEQHQSYRPTFIYLCQYAFQTQGPITHTQIETK